MRKTNFLKTISFAILLVILVKEANCQTSSDTTASITLSQLPDAQTNPLFKPSVSKLGDPFFTGQTGMTKDGKISWVYPVWPLTKTNSYPQIFLSENAGIKALNGTTVSGKVSYIGYTTKGAWVDISKNIFIFNGQKLTPVLKDSIPQKFYNAVIDSQLITTVPK